MNKLDELVRLTADVVLLATREDGQQCVLLIQRGKDPYQGAWALPGGHVDPGEDTATAAVRELTEETGVRGVNVDDLVPVGTYATPGRDPRGRYVTFAYTVTFAKTVAPAAADDASDARWLPVADVVNREVELAFDHRQVVVDALREIDRRAVAEAHLRDPRLGLVADLVDVYALFGGVPVEELRQVIALPFSGYEDSR